ncbi:MAG: hypothetical protein V2A74_09065, partial [bacterium]
FVGHRLLNRFRTKRPDLVVDYLPEAANHFAHPSKFFFFLKPSSAKLLADEPELLRLRKIFIWLLWSIVLYLILFVLLNFLTITLMP